VADADVAGGMTTERLNNTTEQCHTGTECVQVLFTVNTLYKFHTYLNYKLLQNITLCSTYSFSH